MLLVFLDTETTGLNPAKHRTLEIAYKVVDSVSGRVVVSYQTVVSQTAEVWAEADAISLKVNGFTWEETLKGKSERVVESEILNDFNRLELGAREGVFICQNPAFDRAFFNQIVSVDMQVHHGWPYHWLDLASMFWGVRTCHDSAFVKEVKERELSKNSIAHHLGIAAEASPHRAMNGVDHLLACYQALFSGQNVQ